MAMDGEYRSDHVLLSQSISNLNAQCLDTRRLDTAHGLTSSPRMVVGRGFRTWFDVLTSNGNFSIRLALPFGAVRRCPSGGRLSRLAPGHPRFET